jgi:hypothetical protein
MVKVKTTNQRRTDNTMVKVKTTKKDRQYNGQSKKDKGTNNHLQNITQETRY